MKQIIHMTTVVLVVLSGIFLHNIFSHSLLFHPATVFADDAGIPIYLGTYTRGEDGAKGIYLTRLNTKDGSLSEPQLVAQVTNPTFLAKHPTLSRLYAIGEVGGGTPGSSVYAFAIDSESYALTKLNEQSVPAFGACHLGVFPLPKQTDIDASDAHYAVMVAYYTDGAVASLPLTDDGQLAPWVTINKHTGSGPTTRQTRAFAHAVYPTWRSEVAVLDLGADKLFFYTALRDGRLAPSDELAMPPGSGPRHAAFSSATRTAFILNELNSTICVVAFPNEISFIRRSPQILQTISTLPEGKSGEDNYTAEIFLHPNGQFLYASNRGDDTIALFHFDAQAQRLKFMETTPCGGRHPRSFDISPDGQWLIVAAMQSDLVTTFRIDSDTGCLTPTGHSIPVKQCACVFPVEKPFRFSDHDH